MNDNISKLDERPRSQFGFSRSGAGTRGYEVDLDTKLTISPNNHLLRRDREFSLRGPDVPGALRGEEFVLKQVVFVVMHAKAGAMDTARSAAVAVSEQVGDADSAGQEVVHQAGLQKAEFG